MKYVSNFRKLNINDNFLLMEKIRHEAIWLMTTKNLSGAINDLEIC